LSLLCFLSRPRPATSFPSTTLFRSRGVHAPLERTAERSPAPRRQVQLPLIAHAIAARVAAAVRGQVGVAVSLPRIHPGKVPARTDRKSTRLNSSHVKISYAVFCLKK